MSWQRQLLSLGYESCGCLMFIEEPAATGESINRKLTRLLRQSLSSSDARTQYDQPSHCDKWDAVHDIQDAQRSIFINQTKDCFWQQYKGNILKYQVTKKANFSIKREPIALFLSRNARARLLFLLAVSIVSILLPWCLRRQWCSSFSCNAARTLLHLKFRNFSGFLV